MQFIKLLVLWGICWINVRWIGICMASCCKSIVYDAFQFHHSYSWTTAFWIVKWLSTLLFLLSFFLARRPHCIGVVSSALTLFVNGAYIITSGKTLPLPMFVCYRMPPFPIYRKYLQKKEWSLETESEQVLIDFRHCLRNCRDAIYNGHCFVALFWSTERTPYPPESIVNANNCAILKHYIYRKELEKRPISKIPIAVDMTWNYESKCNKSCCILYNTTLNSHERLMQLKSSVVWKSRGVKLHFQHKSNIQVLSKYFLLS